ncbi:MAG: hypothetical protein HOC71_00135, partial [Candidatus Latescibacteria bacterium]|nr:hypothetical protein [Candidatus Latescibacterota bacterium]
ANIDAIGFVEVSTACRDMESSGDGFHYFAFIKSQQDSSPDKSKSHRKLPPKPAATFSEVPAPATLLVDSVLCPACNEANIKERKFCLKCDHPLYRKCNQCRTLIDTVSDMCPVCGANIDEVRSRLVEKVKQDLQPFDIMENGYDVWLRVNKVTLEDNEHVLTIFPRGNFITPGTSVRMNKKDEKSSEEPCDIVLTDRRLILGIGSKLVSTELMRIDTCLVSDNRKFFGGRYVLTIEFNGNMYKVTFPYSSGKTKTVIDILSSFIQEEILV